MKLPEVRASIPCKFFSLPLFLLLYPRLFSPSPTPLLASLSDSIAIPARLCLFALLLLSLSAIRSPCHHECHGQQQRRQRQRQQQHDRGQDGRARQQCSSAERDRQAEQLRAQDEHDAGGGGCLRRYGS